VENGRGKAADGKSCTRTLAKKWGDMELRFFATLFLWVHRYGTHQHGMSSAIRRHAIEGCRPTRFRSGAG